MNMKHVGMGVCLLLTLSVVLACDAFADDSCHRCGGCKHVKKKLCLVKTYEEIEIPAYQCQPATTFYPDKGSVLHSGYRYDKFISIKKHPVCHPHGSCGSGKGCGCNSCPPPTAYTYSCNCKVKEGCVCLKGACPSGQHVCTQVVRPTGKTCKVRVPVLKWVTLPVCSGCCNK